MYIFKYIFKYTFKYIEDIQIVYIKLNVMSVFFPHAFIKMIPLNDVDFYICDINYLTDHIVQIGLHLKK